MSYPDSPHGMARRLPARVNRFTSSIRQRRPRDASRAVSRRPTQLGVRNDQTGCRMNIGLGLVLVTVGAFLQSIPAYGTLLFTAGVLRIGSSASRLILPDSGQPLSCYRTNPR